MKYIKGFDTLRALAIILVIIAHWGPEFPKNTAPGLVKQMLVLGGDFGVYLFFVLSGFLITSILLNEKSKNENENRLIVIKNFFIRRSLRIFPIYYIFILFCFFNYEFVREHIAYYLTYTSNILPYRANHSNILAHTWSLSVEEQFYLLWPWLIIYIPSKYLKHTMFLSIIIGLAARYMVVFVWHHGYPFLSINCIDSFAIGALYALARLNKETCKQFEKGFRTLFPVLLFLLWRIAPYGGLPVAVIFEKFMCDIIALGLIIFAINNEYVWIKKYVLENTVLNYIGRISYGLYLYHFTLGPRYDVFIAAYAKAHPGTPAFFYNYYSAYCIKLTMLFIICWLSFMLIEQPILRIKKRFEYAPSKAS